MTKDDDFSLNDFVPYRLVHTPLLSFNRSRILSVVTPFVCFTRLNGLLNRVKVYLLLRLSPGSWPSLVFWTEVEIYSVFTLLTLFTNLLNKSSSLSLVSPIVRFILLHGLSNRCRGFFPCLTYRPVHASTLTFEQRVEVYPMFHFRIRFRIPSKNLFVFFHSQ